jgi:hypothetical protein
VLAWCSFLLACHSHPREMSHSLPAPPSASAAVVRDAAASVGSSLAGASLPPELARIAPSATLWAGPFDWPAGGASALIGGGSVLVWKNGAGGGTIALPRAAARAIVRDVTGDGKAELVLFSVPSAEPLDEVDETRTWIVGIARRQPPDSSDAGPMEWPARMWLLEGQLRHMCHSASTTRTKRGAARRLGAIRIAHKPDATRWRIRRAAQPREGQSDSSVERRGLRVANAVSRRAGCLNWARPDPCEPRGAIPGATRLLAFKVHAKRNGRTR